MQLGMFDIERRLEKISKLKDPLVRLNEVIPWEMFREILENAMPRKNTLRGRPSYDVVMMFKILVLQSMYNLSDDQMSISSTIA